MLNPEKFLKIDGKELRQIIEERHGVLSQRIEESKKDHEKRARCLGYNNTLRVLDTEIYKIPLDATIFFTEDLTSYELNLAVYQLTRLAKVMLNMYYVSVAFCKRLKGKSFFVIYFAEL